MDQIELHRAIRTQDVETIKALLNRGADVDAVDDDGITALHIASMENSVNIVEILISHGAFVDPRTHKRSNRYTPLHYAVERGHEEIVKILLSNNANVNLHTMSKMLPLDIAVSRKHVGIARDLLSCGASVDSQCPPTYASTHHGSHIYTPPHCAVETGHHELVKLLIDSGADVNAVHIGKLTPLHMAVEEAYIEIVKTLLEHGANVDFEDDRSQTPLCIVMQKVLTMIQSSKSECGNDADSKYKELETRYETITKLLLEHKAVFNPEKEIFQKGLHAAVKMESTTTVECIVKCFPDAIASCRNPSKNNCTLLHTAAESWNAKLVEFLIHNGADVNAEDQQGRTPIFYVVNEDYKSPSRQLKSPADALKIAELLLNNGGNADTGAKNTKTPLHHAVENCHNEMVELLLMHNACVESHVESGLSPLHTAAIKQHARIAEVLLNNGARLNSKWAQACKCWSHVSYNLPRPSVVTGSPEYWLSSDSCPSSPEYYPSSPGYCPSPPGNRPTSPSCVPNKSVLNSKPVRYSIPLDCAAKNGHQELVNLFLSRSDANSADDSTPLCSAINRGHDRIVKLLLDHGFKVDVDDKKLQAALFWAVGHGYIATVEHILKSRPSVNEPVDQEGHTLLLKAIIHRQPKLVELLVKHGSDVNAVDSDGKSPLLHVLESAVRHIPAWLDKIDHFKDPTSTGFDTMVKCLFEHGARIDSTAENLQTMLRRVTEKGRCTLIELVLKHCSSVQVLLHANGSPLLHTAVQENRAEVARVLIKCGASVNATNKIGKTALHLAASKDHEVFELLTEYGAEVDRRDGDGKTALHIAAIRGSVEVMTILLEYGADVNITSNDNFTPLDYALERFKILGDDTTQDQILIKHLIKMKAANLFVNQHNLRCIDMSNFYNDLYNTCKAECEKMMKTKVADTGLSLYDILTGIHSAKNDSTSSFLKALGQWQSDIRNESVFRTLESRDYEGQFPLYSDWMKNHFKRAQKRVDLLNRSATLFNSLIRYELPANLIMEISSHLSNLDLENLIEAYTNDNCEKLYEFIERKKRENNVIIKGFVVKNRNNVEVEVRTFLKWLAGKEIKLDYVRQLQDEGRNTYLVRFAEFASKNFVMGRKKKLKGRNIFIENDPTKRQKDIQKWLERKAHRASHAGKRSYAECTKLWVNDREYEWNEDTEQLEERKTRGSNRRNPGRNQSYPGCWLSSTKREDRPRKRVKKSTLKKNATRDMKGNRAS